MTDSRTNELVTIRGSGNFAGCRAVLNELTYVDATPCFYGDGNVTDCSINGVYTPDIPDDTIFLAVSAYYFAAQGVGFECTLAHMYEFETAVRVVVFALHCVAFPARLLVAFILVRLYKGGRAHVVYNHNLTAHQAH